MKNKILFLGAAILILAGCATSTRYDAYTSQRFAPKDVLYPVKVYSQAQPPPENTPYFVVGRVSIEGFASNGVTPGSLTSQAIDIARKKGADAIINATTQFFRYYGGDALLRFKGELIVYSPQASK